MNFKIDSEYEATLERITELLSSEGVQYALTGGYLTALYGDPRSTQDIDLIVSISSACKGDAPQ